MARLSRSGQIHEIGQELQAGRLAFFRVKLGGEYVVAMDRAGEFAPVVRTSDNNGFVRRLGMIAVDEIEIGAVLNTGEQRTSGLHQFDLIPTDLGDF